MKRLILFLLLLPIALQAQNINYLHKVIDTLASPYMHGRAYCTGGDKTAAQFIVSQLERFRVKPLTDNYLQTFNIKKNCITDSVYLFLDGHKLTPGVDYLIWGNTPSITGNYYLRLLRKPQKWQKFARKHKLDSTFVVVRYSDIQKLKKDRQKVRKAIEDNRLQAAGIIILKENFYYAPRDHQKFYPLIYMKPGAFKKRYRSISLKVDARVRDFETQNILGYIPGRIDSFIVFTAHYDHLGVFGQIYFPGANDNASGTAVLLDLAHKFANRKTPPKYNVAFLFFSGEEMGLKGSLYYVQHPAFDLSKIKLLINLDMVGSGDKGITIVNGKELTDVTETIKKINGKYNLLPDIKTRLNAPNSDHYPFTMVGVPAIFIYTRGDYKEYHNIYDRREKVPLSKTAYLVKLLYYLVETY